MVPTVAHDPLVLAMLTIIVGLVGALWRGMRDDRREDRERFEKLSEKVGQIMGHAQQCAEKYAHSAKNSEDHRRIWSKVDEHDAVLNTLTTRVVILEQKE